VIQASEANGVEGVEEGFGPRPSSRSRRPRKLKSKCVCSILDVLGLVKGNLIYLCYNFGAFRPLVPYAQIRRCIVPAFH
jgi:hypothetical protein